MKRRGLVWIPINYLIIQTLYQLHNFYSDTLQFKYPTGSGNIFKYKQISRYLISQINFNFYYR